jgi:hypothetical protein
MSVAEAKARLRGLVERKPTKPDLTLVRKHPWEVVLGAVILGLLVGRNPNLAEILLKALLAFLGLPVPDRR